MPLTNRRHKEIASLSRKKYRTQLGQMLVEGVRSVDAALEAGAPLTEVLAMEAVREDARVRDLLHRAQAAGVPVHVVPAAAFEPLSAVETSQGVLAVARTEHYPLDQLATQQTVLALDGVQDPGNVGTLVRTAAWFGVDAVLAGAGTAGFFNPKVVRAAMGGLWDVHLAATDDLPARLMALQAAGFGLYGADLGGTAVPAWSPRAPSVLVLGSEAHGLSDAVRQRLDARVTIRGAARRAGAESLNVAIAGGILMHAWRRQVP